MHIMLRLFSFLLCVSIVFPVLAQTDLGALSYDKMLSGYAYPFKIHRRSFTSQGQSLEMAYMYLRDGDESPHTSANQKTGNRPVVLLLHGKNFNGAYWADTARMLVAEGYDVLIPDQIGFGKSSKPKNYQYSFASLAQNTQGLIDSLDIKKVIVVGHSMGGMLASRFALMYPDITHQVVLVNPIGLENYLQYVQYKDIAFFYSNEKEASSDKIISYQKKNYYDGQWNAAYQALTYPLIGWIQGPDADLMASVSARCYDMIFTQPVIEEFKNFKVPVTLILGTRDRTGPGRNWMRDGVTYELGRYDLLGDRVKKRNRAITLVKIKGVGHLPHIEDFPRFKKAFLKALR